MPRSLRTFIAVRSLFATLSTPRTQIGAQRRTYRGRTRAAGRLYLAPAGKRTQASTVLPQSMVLRVLQRDDSAAIPQRCAFRSTRAQIFHCRHKCQHVRLWRGGRTLTNRQLAAVRHYVTPVRQRVPAFWSYVRCRFALPEAGTVSNHCNQIPLQDWRPPRHRVYRPGAGQEQPGNPALPRWIGLSPTRSYRYPGREQRLVATGPQEQKERLQSCFFETPIENYSLG
jgi:hypothetical protein